MNEVTSPAGSVASLAIEVEALVREAAWRASRLCEAASDQGAGRRSALEAAQLSLYRRGLREQLLPGSLFSDPAWDLLLHLFVAQCEERDLGIGELCAASKLSEATALRWLRALAAAGHVQSAPEAGELRSGGVMLTPTATSALTIVLETSRA